MRAPNLQCKYELLYRYTVYMFCIYKSVFRPCRTIRFVADLKTLLCSDFLLEQIALSCCYRNFSPIYFPLILTICLAFNDCF